VLFNYCIGASYYDCVQLNEGYIDSRKNFIDNPSFELESLLTADTPSDWTLSSSAVTWEEDFNTTNNIFSKILGNYALKWLVILALLFGLELCLQNVDNTSGNTHILIGGWAYSGNSNYIC
jgi:hypothetical protein